MNSSRARGFLVACVLLAGAVVVAPGCYTSDQGLNPPHDSFYYPTGLVVSPGRSRLYVVNSDFDLQYNGGTVQAFDLGTLRSKWIAPLLDAVRSGSCNSADGSITLPPNQNPVLNPGPCQAIPTDQIAPQIGAVATVGAFASGAALGAGAASDGTQHARLFVPVRGDPSITYFDIDDDRMQSSSAVVLDCGQSGDVDARCAPIHKVGQNPFDNVRRLTLPVEPVGIAGDDKAESFVVAHQTEKAASLIVNRWDQPDHPTLQFFLTNLPDGPTEVASIPIPALFKNFAPPASSLQPYQPGFLLTYSAAPEIDILRYQSDSVASPPRAFITRAGGFGISVNQQGSDSRGVAVDAHERAACEAACDAVDGACQRACLAIPLAIYIANRAPASLLVGRVLTTAVDAPDGTVGGFDVVSIDDSIPLTFGASKVAIGDVIDETGARRSHVFAVAFESRFVFSYDPRAHRVDAIIRTGRGPHAIAVDTGDDGDGRGLHSFLYVGHFTDSYIGVVDLDMRHPDTFGTMFASLGAPLPPREAK